MVQSDPLNAETLEKNFGGSRRDWEVTLEELSAPEKNALHRLFNGWLATSDKLSSAEKYRFRRAAGFRAVGRYKRALYWLRDHSLLGV